MRKLYLAGESVPIPLEANGDAGVGPVVGCGLQRALHDRGGFESNDPDSMTPRRRPKLPRSQLRIQRALRRVIYQIWRNYFALGRILESGAPFRGLADKWRYVILSQPVGVPTRRACSANRVGNIRRPS